MEERKREVIKVTEEEIDDFTSNGTWEIRGEVYNFVTDDQDFNSCDGECHEVIVQRESDKKYFKFGWWYHPSSGDYIYEDEEWVEVFRKEITTVIYE